MKKILLTLSLLLLPFLSVNADITYSISKQDFISYNKYSSYTGSTDFGIYLANKYVFNDFSYFYADNTNKNIFDELYSNILATITDSQISVNTNLYSVLIISNSNSTFDLNSVYIIYGDDNSGAYSFYANGTYYSDWWSTFIGKSCREEYNSYYFYPCTVFSGLGAYSPFRLDRTDNSNTTWYYYPTLSFMSFENHYNQSETITFDVYDGATLDFSVGPGDPFPVLYPNGSFNPSNTLTTINLDDYEYVILSLKNYNQSNAFQTNLQLKGQIGITPVYNYGRTSKDSVSGSQVQDRCNLAYSDFTTYPFYILQTDLQNNAVYYVRECTSGSSFKYDNTIFDVSFVTQSNLNSPSVTINGTTYNTIPYDDLPSTATQNEIDNYIPGESSSSIDATTDGLNSAIKNANSWLSNMWSTFTYFTSFVGQLFSALPNELHAILLTAFTFTIIIGLIKHFTG